jgi:hypothetical protein
MSIQLTVIQQSLVNSVVHTHLEGTTPLCHSFQLVVQFLCDGKVGATQTVQVSPAGNWTADFTMCECGQDIVIQARCNDVPAPPWEKLWQNKVPCTPKCCPTATLSSVLGECVGGKRAVRLVADLTLPPAPCPTVNVRWTFGDGNASAWTPFTPAASSPTVVQLDEGHLYPCDKKYKATLEMNGSDFKCPPQELEVDVPCCGCCPTVKVSAVLGGCTGVMRDVKLVADLVIPAAPCPPLTAQWDFQDGTMSPPVTYTPGAAAATETLEVWKAYECGFEYTAAVKVTGSDFTCPATPLRLNIECCDPTTPSCCPTLSLSPTEGKCDVKGGRPVTVGYTITPASDPACPGIEGELALAGQTVAITASSLTGTMSFQSLQPGHYTATLTLVSPRDCPPVEVGFDVHRCDCCPASVVTADVAEKCNADLTKHVKVEAQIIPIPGCPVTAVMSIEGSVVDSGAGAGPFTLKAEGDYDCGRHPVTISYAGMDCPDGGGEFCVPVCETGQCRSKRLFFEFFAMVTLLSLALYLMSPPQPYLLTTATTALVVALIVYNCWKPCLHRCRRCQLLLALWEVLLATFLGLILLGKWAFQFLLMVFSAYVSVGLAMLIILLLVLLMAVLIYLLYKMWVAQCCPTECDRWTEVYDTLTFVTLAGTAIVTSVLAAWGVAGLFVAPVMGFLMSLLILYVLWKKTLACKL